MSARAREVTPESYALPAVVLAFVTAGMRKEGGACVCEEECGGKYLCSPLPDIFGDSHSFVVVLA